MMDPHSRRVLPLVTATISVTILAMLYAAAPSRAHAAFVYGPVSEPIVSATFSGDFAALVAHRTVGGFEVNHVTLIDPLGGVPDLLLSDEFFGSAELLSGETPKINQGPLETGVVSASIPSSFFPVLQQGLVGLSFLGTDTDDGLFAIDFLALAIETTSGTVTSFIDPDNGFGIGLPNGGTLSVPLPISIPVEATGRGFDEAISSKSIEDVPVPEPAAMILLGLGLGLLCLCTQSHVFPRRRS